MTEETQEDHINHIGDCTGKLVAKERPKQTSTNPTSFSLTATLPRHLRDRIDVEPSQSDKRCFEVSKKDDQIASTRSFSTSRRRRSSRIQNLSQRCISARQMTDNMFEIETAALAHVACAPRESCTRLGRKLSLNCLFAGRNNNNL